MQNIKSDRNTYKGKKGIARVVNAIRYSIAGYIFAWKDEEAFRQIVVMCLVALPVSFFVGDSYTEIFILMLPLVICLIVELLNSAIENAVDRISLEIHPLAKKAKDMASAAQFSAQLFVYITWITMILNKTFFS